MFASTLPAYPLPDNFNASRVYSIALDGRGRKNLSGPAGAAGDELASLSPDGTKIVFFRAGELWLINTDGTGLRRLLTPTPHEFFSDQSFRPPAWSPDGTRLAVNVWGDARCPGYTPPGGLPYPCASWWVLFVDLQGNKLGRIDEARNASWSPDGKWLAFEAGDFNDWEFQHVGVVIASPDGSAPRTLGRGIHNSTGCWGLPSWSSNGKWIAFAETDCSSETVNLYLVPAAGGRARRLAGARDPVWSPDGSRLAFLRGSVLFLGRGDGTSARRLVRFAGVPAWSPKGGRLAFVSEQTGQTGDEFYEQTGQIYVVEVGSGARRRLTRELPTSRLKLLAWSRDGRRLLYTSAVYPEPNTHLWTMNPDGSGLTRLTSKGFGDFGPSWSPDGGRIAFVRWSAPDKEGESTAAIYTMRASGRDLKLLVSGPSESDLAPAWSPDGRRLVFARSAALGGGLFLMTSNGSGLRRLTRDPDFPCIGVHCDRASAPAWSPDGRWIAFSSGRGNRCHQDKRRRATYARRSGRCHRSCLVAGRKHDRFCRVLRS